MKRLFRLLLVLSLAVATRAGAEVIVWDFGPDSGLLTPREGGSSVWVNMSNGQNFCDSVVFPADTEIIGYNLFTAASRLQHPADTYCVRVWNSSPGSSSLMREILVAASDVQFVGDFMTIGGHKTDVYQISLRFDPLLLAAGATYWIGASGLNHDMGAYGVVGPGDQFWVQMHGKEFSWAGSQFGDLAFQLVAVPEPSSLALMPAGFALTLLAGRMGMRGSVSPRV